MDNFLLGKNIVVYDCEIEEEIDGKKVTWDTHDKMGLSVACLFDYKTQDWNVYFREDLSALVERLNFADLVVGFNTTGFDNKLLRALGGDLKPDMQPDSLQRWEPTKESRPLGLSNYDMLYWSRRAMGWTEKARFPSGMKLDNHLASTFGKEHLKTEDGAMAPVLWKKGERARVVSYCLADVKREKMLFEQIAYNGWVSTEAHGRREIDRSIINKVCNISC